MLYHKKNIFLFMCLYSLFYKIKFKNNNSLFKKIYYSFKK